MSIWSLPELVKGKSYVWKVPGPQIIEVWQSAQVIFMHIYSVHLCFSRPLL